MSRPRKRLVFFGTPDWAVPSLRAIASSGWDMIAVVTNPDRPAGRGYELKAPPVKMAALEHGIEVMQPEKARDESFIEQIRSLEPTVCVVVAYGKILPAALLEVPPLGFVNLHFSLLPAYRGAAPVQRAVMDGLERTGLSIMKLTEGMDEGPVLSELEVDIGPEENAGELGARLAEVGAPLLVETLDGYLDGSRTPREQDHGAATYAPKIDNDEARLEWSRPARELHALVRGLNPVPGAWTTFRGERVKVHRVALASDSGEPGNLLSSEPAVVAAGDGALRLVEVQPAGKKRMPAEDWARGVHPSPGESFGDD